MTSGKQSYNPLYGSLSGTWTQIRRGIEPYSVLLDEEKMIGSAGVEDPWSVDFPFDQILGRRRIMRSGWINKPD
jgi:hypothetical protein